MCVTRALSGLGLAIASPAAFGIIGVNIRQEPARTIVFAAFGLGNPMGAAFGCIIAGVMSSIGQGSWSYLFYLLAGAAIVLLVIAYFVVPPDPPSVSGKDLRIDWIGGALVTASVCLFTFSLTESGVASEGWKAPRK
ncbi:uncharacterized protein MKK02DRAFT_43710 [Dioszegia hungarica]|uniref:Major facilitator superfamily (MFS) profile domain-containing protein n=1 Tax=Dioszegia hungarica TaxID=4972 RepID=A0AA38H9M1_9TREE|nr:uncharacterized protein MKK02DRAFT_43710 [Dioszegia hungarica]KAI9635034.1 hypothetical protein MKK02DRAFT_43710 [Dioszegia hungarica]